MVIREIQGLEKKKRENFLRNSPKKKVFTMKKLIEVIIPLVLLLGGIFFLKENLTVNETPTTESRVPDNEPTPKLNLKAVVLRTDDSLEAVDQESIYHGEFPYYNMDSTKTYTFSLHFVTSSGEALLDQNEEPLIASRKMKLVTQKGKIVFFLEANDLMREYLFDLDDVMIRAKLESIAD